MKATGWRTLFDGSDLAKWVIGGVELDGAALAIREGEVRAEAGGMSWDNYILRGEFLISPRGNTPKYCVQLTADGTGVYCQLVPHCMLIAYYCDRPKTKPKGFTHLIAPAQVRAPHKAWFTFTMRASQGRVTGMVDGKEIASARIPSGSQGMPGFLVNQLKDCDVKVRNIKIKFLRPTKRQLDEFAKHPLYNWLRHVEQMKRK